VLPFGGSGVDTRLQEIEAEFARHRPTSRMDGMVVQNKANVSRTGVGWDKDFQYGTGRMTKLKAECGFEPLGYNQNHVTIAIDI
jgi:hypothetical protein